MTGIARTIDQVPQRQHNEDRLRRAYSWHRRSEEATSDAERFIFLWISFNAAYGADVTAAYLEETPRERDKFGVFLQNIVDRDDDGVLEQFLWDKNAPLIRRLLENQYVFKPFWDAVSGSPGAERWEDRFRQANQRLSDARRYRDVRGVLREVFLRLYTLRNQLFHGGATYATGWGGNQVRDGARIMEALVPVILDTMRADIETNPESEVWGLIAYPRINYERA